MAAQDQEQTLITLVAAVGLLPQVKMAALFLASRVMVETAYFQQFQVLVFITAAAVEVGRLTVVV
jgi:hypothetical protein